MVWCFCSCRRAGHDWPCLDSHSDNVPTRLLWGPTASLVPTLLMCLALSSCCRAVHQLPSSERKQQNQCQILAPAESKRDAIRVVGGFYSCSANFLHHYYAQADLHSTTTRNAGKGDFARKTCNTTTTVAPFVRVDHVSFKVAVVFPVSGD